MYAVSMMISLGSGSAQWKAESAEVRPSSVKSKPEKPERLRPDLVGAATWRSSGGAVVESGKKGAVAEYAFLNS